MIQETATIIGHKELAPRFFKITLQSKYISSNALPGQFVEIRVADETAPLLRKPFSIHKMDPAKQSIEVLCEVVGPGTELLSKKQVGQKLSVLGPLGHGFEIGNDKKIALLVGGGMGVAPLLALCGSIKGSFDAVHVFIGSRTGTAVLCENDFKDLGAQVHISTDDGTSGKKGLVSDVLLNFLTNEFRTSSLEQATIYACGSRPMLKAVAEIAQQKQIDCQLSMEAYMACGIGACKGCAVMTKNGYKMACKDGPVFSAKDIIW